MVDVNPAQVWNLCIVALCAALVASRLLLVVVNWRDLLRHPLWMLGLAMIHHPLLAAAGVLAGAAGAFAYARWQRMPLARTADALAAPIALGVACEQVGALLAGSGYGLDAEVPWAVTYTSPLAARWSGTPLGVPLHPVQGYAALGAFTVAVLAFLWLRLRRQEGDAAGVALLGAGLVTFVTEFWRDREGRAGMLHGAVDAPQILAIALVLCGAVLLRERPSARVFREVSHV